MVHLKQKLTFFTFFGFLTAFLLTAGFLLALGESTLAALPEIQQNQPAVISATEAPTPYVDLGGVLLPQITLPPAGGQVTVPHFLATATATPTLIPQVGGAIAGYSNYALPTLVGLMIGLVILSSLLLLRKGKNLK